MAQIDALQLKVHAVLNLLIGLALMARKDGAQILMPRNDQIEGLFQLVDIELATDGDRRGDVVACAVRLELVDEPQSFLGKAQRQPVELRSIDGSYGGNITFFRLHDQL